MNDKPQQPYTDTDLALVSKVLKDTLTPWTFEHCTDEDFATAVLDALATAGRLQPPGVEQQWGIRSKWLEGDCDQKFDTRAEAEWVMQTGPRDFRQVSVLITRYAGPWVEVDTKEEPARCCDLHGRNCEQGGEECCSSCTEAHHFAPAHGGVPCSNPDLSRAALSKEEPTDA